MALAQGISVKAHDLGARGLKYDRLWMVVDEDGNFVTQRTVPRMCLIAPSLPSSDHEPLELTAPGMTSISVPVLGRKSGAETKTVTVRGLPCEAQDQEQPFKTLRKNGRRRCWPPPSPFACHDVPLFTRAETSLMRHRPCTQVFFGQKVVTGKSGTLKVGDRVRVTR